MRLSKAQLQGVINSLPRADCYEGEFIKIRVREVSEPQILVTDIACNVNARFFEFQKSEDGDEWLLASVPEF